MVRSAKLSSASRQNCAIRAKRCALFPPPAFYPRADPDLSNTARTGRVQSVDRPAHHHALGSPRSRLLVPVDVVHLALALVARSGQRRRVRPVPRVPHQVVRQLEARRRPRQERPESREPPQDSHRRARLAPRNERDPAHDRRPRRSQGQSSLNSLPNIPTDSATGPASSTPRTSTTTCR